LASVLDPGDSPTITLDQWLTEHIGANEAANGAVAIIDLSLVPSDVIHIVVAVLGRMVFEAVQRYRRTQTKVLPTVLVLEEAHTFVHRDLADDGAPPAGRACCKIFERIAREGRKFGLGLVLSSQRPSEMSPTVLSQCNTFLLHRIVNDRDQELVRRLVPDALGDLLRELPSLPSRRAILLGWGAPAPVLIEVREVPEDQRPHSPDPDFWDVWTGTKARSINWKALADAWVTASKSGQESESPPSGQGTGS
jgi:DNA helicase HerA-like ATPase